MKTLDNQVEEFKQKFLLIAEHEYSMEETDFSANEFIDALKCGWSPRDLMNHLAEKYDLQSESDLDYFPRQDRVSIK